MKIKTDFVTNSSSSSFIIAVKAVNFKENEEIKLFFEKYPIIKTAYDQYVSMIQGFFGVPVTPNIDKIYDFFQNQYGITKEEIESETYGKNDKERYKKIIDALADGYEIYERWVDYSDESTERMLDTLEKQGMIRILWTSG